MASAHLAKFDWAFLAAELEEARIDDRTGFEAWTYERLASVLVSAREWNSGVPEAEKRGAVRRGIKRAASSGTISGKSLKAAIDREERTFLDTPVSRFLAVTSLSVRLPDKVSTIRLLNGRVALHKQFPRPLLKQRRSGTYKLDDADRTLTPEYSAVVIKVDARSPHEAMHKAFAELDFARSIWNYGINATTLMSYPFKPQPVNRVRTGRVHTLHNADGTLAIDNYWYDPAYVRAESTSLNKEEWNRARRLYRAILVRLRSIAYSAAIRRHLTEYGRALDTSDMEASFLKLWRTLEITTGTGGRKYDDTVRRASAVFRDRMSALQVLEHLRFQRNATMHEGDGSDDTGTLVYQLKYFVEEVLRFHISLGREFTSFEEAGRFLDMPTEPTELRRRLKLMQRALRYHQS